jgi:thiamine pyrophosphate-dependent acetolactate synthase large subunit-like protein
MPVFYINALARYRADAFQALTQINGYISSQLDIKQELGSAEYAARKSALVRAHRDFVSGIASQAKPDANGHYQTAYLVSQLRKYCPADTIWCIEAVTQTQIVADHIQATLPGSFVNCGGGGLGWSGGG